MQAAESCSYVWAAAQPELLTSAAQCKLLRWALLQKQSKALTDAWIGNMLMDPLKGKQEVITTNNKVTPSAMTLRLSILPFSEMLTFFFVMMHAYQQGVPLVLCMTQCRPDMSRCSSCVSIAMLW